MFTTLKHLVYFDLSYNQLTTLPADMFDHFDSNVEFSTLLLYSNKISSLPEGIFKNLSYLYDLNLSYNRLSSVSAEIFTGLTEMYYLNLSNNPLISFPKGTIESLGSEGSYKRVKLYSTCLNTEDSEITDYLDDNNGSY
jgi:Leucine-rich repeat (LRR) protein